jgi:hypothetical protein
MIYFSGFRTLELCSLDASAVLGIPLGTPWEFKSLRFMANFTDIGIVNLFSFKSEIGDQLKLFVLYNLIYIVPILMICPN